ncbi:MAG: beta-ketoacyl synthase N-terminal-like domain-containing protein, partial [Cyanobacteria bacterium J06558_2]
MPDYKALMQKALSEINDLRAQLQQEKNKNNEPIAIIGMGCRFPGGANTPEAFWELLVNGVDAISEVPSDRWNIEDYYDANPVTPGKMNVRYGGFVDRLKEFDADFFGISPREANSLDPQQRLLLEVTWEALENAGVVPQTEESKNTGVFVGISSNDYSQLLLERDNTEIDAYLATGNSHSTAAGRISFLLGFTAPSMAVDTACSSSLVTVHLACKSLRDQECSLAVAGGVQRLITPEFTINFSQARMLAPDGRCKTFDAAADGFSRGEGCGMVVLKRLRDAVRDGDNILAVVRGSAVNQDGRSSGLTVPNGVSQQRVIRQALANSGVEASAIDYIEAHGTGTSLGDPIEITALGEVFSRNNDNHLLIGSVKTNIGHLEAAAGIAGIIKVVLSLQHQQIPPHLHFHQPNPYIDWENAGVSVVSQGKEWQGDNLRLAGVSSFGFSGTNAHLVVGDVEISAKTDRKIGRYYPLVGWGDVIPLWDEERELQIFTLSAKSETALENLVKKYQEYLSSPATFSIKDICYTASVGRSHFDYRGAIVARDIEELQQQLAEFPGDLSVRENKNLIQQHKVAFLFTGQGSQYLNMGQELYATQPVFRENCDRCFKLFNDYLETPLQEVIFSSASQRLNETRYTQPAIFTIEYALAQMWFSWGVKPDIVMGHSIGEFVAAAIAGVFSLEDAVKLVAHRGKLMQELPTNGEMFVIKADEQGVNNVIENISGVVNIAAVNNSENTVISGERETIQQAIAIFNQQNIKTTRLEVSHAFHSALMESILPNFNNIAREVSYSRPQITFVSNVTGTKIDHDLATAEYWVNHICQPVRFAQGMETLGELKCNVFLEIGAKPILLGMRRLALEAKGRRRLLWLPSLRDKQSDWQSILSSVAGLYTNNINLDWASFYQNKGQILPLPTYPFQRQQYWLSGKKKIMLGGHRDLPLLGSEIKLAKSNQRIWQNQISQAEPNYLTNHQVWQQVIFPSAGYIEMVLRVGKEIFQSSHLEIKNISFNQPLILSESLTELQLVLNAEKADNSGNFEIFSCNNNSSWTNNCQGKILAASVNNSQVDLAQYQQEIKQVINIPKYYQDLEECGLEYGANFRAIADLYHDLDRALGRIELPVNLPADNYLIHPILLDACLQVAGAAIKNNQESETYLPVAIESLTFNCDRLTENIIWSHAEIISYNAGIYTINFELINQQQEIIATIDGLKIKAVGSSILNQRNIDDWLYQIEWRDNPLPVVRDNSYIDLKDIQAVTSQKFEQLISDLEFSQYLEILRESENISVDYIINALVKLGVNFNSEQFPSLDIESLGIRKEHQQLWLRSLAILAEAGIIIKNNADWQIMKTPDLNNINDQQQRLLEQYPQAQAELTLLHNCASQLDQVFLGNIDPKELLFPNGDLSLTTNLYQDSPGAKVTNTLVAETIKQLLVNQPQDKTLKILEIGAGTGGTTAYLLPELNSQNVEYTFSDLSPLFLAKAQEKFSDYNFVKYQLLNISQLAAHQETYDLIIAANVLHATADLKQTLNNARSLLNPQGLLIIVEGTQPVRWFDLTFGMTEGWWKFSDRQLRANYPLISEDTWQEILLEADFTEVVNLCDRPTSETKLQQSVIVAQASKRKPFDQHYLIFNDTQGIGTGISNYLTEQLLEHTLVNIASEFKQAEDNQYQINPRNLEECDRLFQDLKQQSKNCQNVIYLSALDSNQDQLDIEQQTNAALSITQAIIKNNISPTNLYLVTRDAVALDQSITIKGLSQSSLHGLVKVINLEHPEINCSCIDLDSSSTLQQQVDNLISEIQTTIHAEQIIWRHNTRKIARLTRYKQTAKLLTLPKNKPYQLSTSQKGTPENLQLIPLQRRQPNANEVEIKIKTTGLNFIDVLDSLGLLPFTKDWFGVECAGEIVAVGSAVTDLAVGDAVIALATGSFNQYVTVNRLMVVAKPENLSWESAVTIPANFLTASYALSECRVKENQPVRILIHAAAGGTGMAVVQLAQLAGMEIFATASPSKWEFLRSLGIKHVMNSRNLEFAEEVMQLTQEEGVDIVFNSLSGEFSDRSLAILKDDGHFIEIGKRNLKSKSEIAKIKPNISYSLIDLFTTAQQQPGLIQALLTKLVARFATGELTPLPHKIFNISETINAFQYMQQAKHIGKIVINHDNSVESLHNTSLKIHDDKIYLIAGGLGDLGLLTADWLV